MKARRIRKGHIKSNLKTKQDVQEKIIESTRDK